MLTTAQIDDYNRDGYLLLRDFFSQEELHATKKEIEEVVGFYLQKAGVNEKMDLDSALIRLEQINHDFVAAVYDTICMSSSFLRLQHKKRIQEVVNQLLGNESGSPLYAFKNRVRIDPPADSRRTYGWHQEVFYTIPRSKFVQIWAPVVRDTTIENGTISVAVGSHNAGIPQQEWITKAGHADQITRKQISKEYEPLQIEMKLGEVLFFTGRTWHKSGNNTSKEHRFSMIGMWHDIGNKEFMAPKINFEYRKESPQEYYSSFSWDKE